MQLRLRQGIEPVLLARPVRLEQRQQQALMLLPVQLRLLESFCRR